MKKRLNVILILLFFFIILLLNIFVTSSISSPTPTPTPSWSPTPPPTISLSPSPSSAPRSIPIILPKIDNIYFNKSYPKPLNPPITYQYSSETQEVPYEKLIDGICIDCGVSVQLTEAEKQKIRERIKKENPPRNYINWQNNEKFYVPEPKIDSISEDSNYYIIQLYSPLYGIASELNSPDRQEILNSLTILDATDENAFFVKILKDNLQKVKDLVKNNKIRYLGEIQDESKIDKSLSKKIQDSPAEKFKITISIYEENSGQISNIKALLGTPDYIGEETISGSADSLKIKEISKLKYVKFIEENLPIYTQNLISTMAIGSDIVNFKGVGGKGVNVAVLDSGLGNSNETGKDSLKDFEGRIIDKYNFIFLGDSENIDDESVCDYHGTHVAGIIGGNGNLSNGFFAGVAPQANLLIYKMGNRLLWGLLGEECAALELSFKPALKRAAEKNADIVSTSMGGGHNLLGEGSNNKYDTLAEHYDEAVRGEYGREMTAVIAAGNDNKFVDSPGTAKNVITVGAVGSGSLMDWPPGERAGFSNYGPIDTDDDGKKRNKPDVMAPGVGIISNSVDYDNRYPGEYYQIMSGTSMSTPFVSGLIALFLEKYPQFKYWPDIIKAQIINTAIPSGPIDNYGYGIIDSYRMIYDDNSFETLKIFGDYIDQSTPKEFSFDIPANTKELRITLVWSDPAGNKEAANRIRFDLTLPNNSTIAPTFSTDDNVLHYIIKGNLVPSGNYKMNITAYMEDGVDSTQSFGLAIGAIYKQPFLSLKVEAEKSIVQKGENFTITAELSNDGYTASGSYISMDRFSIDELFHFEFSAIDVYKADGTNYTYDNKYISTNYNNFYEEGNRTYVETGEIAKNYPRKIVWHLKPVENHQDDQYNLAEGEYTFTIKGNARNANEVTSKVTIYYNKDGNCACTSWQDQQCGQDICPSGQMLQTRTCSPSSCQVEKRCVARDYCEAGGRGFCEGNAFPHTDNIKQITNGVHCANPWRVADVYKEGWPKRYLLIKPGEKQFVRHWLSCTANTDSCPKCQVIDFKGRKTPESSYISLGCTKDYDNNLQLSSEFCDSSKEYSFNDVFFDSPSDHVTIPDFFCSVAEVPDLSQKTGRGWRTYNLSDALILYCAQNEDCGEGYYCERPITGDPLSNYCKKGTGKTITVCKTGTCDFTNPWEALRFADSRDKIIITDQATYNTRLSLFKAQYFYNDGSSGAIVGQSDINIDFDCNGATINASGEDVGIYISGNKATIKNCKILNAEENIRIQGDNNILSNLEILNAKEHNIVIFGDNNIVTNSKISNAKDVGIYLGENNENNEIKENIIKNNTHGILIDKNNTGAIYNNKIVNNTIVGIYSRYNKKGMNIFLNELINRENAYSQNSNNTWFMQEIGNHWSDYDELKEGCIDRDKNHICDSPYKYGEISDNFPITPFDYIAPNTPPTTPPLVQLAPSKAFKNIEFTCTASGSSDIDNDPITYHYEFKKGSTLLQAYSINQQYTCKDNCNSGDLIYCNAKAYDGKDYSNVLKSNTIEIQNSAPVLTPIADKKVKENETLSFVIQASDIDKDKLTLTAQNLPNRASFKDNSDGTGAFSWIPSFEQSGNYKIIFKVNDSELENKQEINITIENVCQNICFASDATQCSSNIQQTCGDYNSDTCLEWGNDIICQAGCSNNICQEGPKPDLTISSFIVQYPRTATIPQNTKISLAFAIKNIGNADATNVFWKYSLTGESDQKNTNALSIPVGGSKTIFVLSNVKSAGAYSAKVIADPDNKIAELNEANNEKTLALQVA